MRATGYAGCTRAVAEQLDPNAKAFLHINTYARLSGI